MKTIINELKDIEIHLTTLKLVKEHSFHELIHSKSDNLESAELLIKQTIQLDSACGFISLTIQTLERTLSH